MAAHRGQRRVDLPGLDSGNILLCQTGQIGERCLRQSGLLARFSYGLSEMSLQFGAALGRVG
jgi:hypothetical protein